MIAFNMEKDVSILGLDAYLQHSFLVKKEPKKIKNLRITSNTNFIF